MTETTLFLLVGVFGSLILLLGFSLRAAQEQIQLLTEERDRMKTLLSEAHKAMFEQARSFREPKPTAESAERTLKVLVAGEQVLVARQHLLLFRGLSLDELLKGLLVLFQGLHTLDELRDRLDRFWRYETYPFSVRSALPRPEDGSELGLNLGEYLSYYLASPRSAFHFVASDQRSYKFKNEQRRYEHHEEEQPEGSGRKVILQEVSGEPSYGYDAGDRGVPLGPVDSHGPSRSEAPATNEGAVESDDPGKDPSRKIEADRLSPEAPAGEDRR